MHAHLVENTVDLLLGGVDCVVGALDGHRTHAVRIRLPRDLHVTAGLRLQLLDGFTTTADQQTDAITRD